jgi:hypothetical protein
MRSYLWIVLVAVLGSPASAQQRKLQAMECISAEPAGEDVRIKNRCSAAVNVTFCVQGNPRSTLRCPDKPAAGYIRAGGFTTARLVAREGGHLVWGACFEPHGPNGFKGVGQFVCR